MGLGHCTRLARIAFVASLLVAALPLVARPVQAGNYSVTNTKDDAQPGSLRRAIIDADNHPGPDTIEFNISASDPGYSSATKVWMIRLLSPLPTLTDNSTVIDGATQTTNRGDTNAQGPEVQIDGSNLGGDASLFYVQSNANQILSLVLTSAPGPAIRVNVGAAGNIIRDNYIGTDPSGITAKGNGAGIHVTAGARENIIAHNVISGNAQDGIVVSGHGTDENKIRRNYIGLNPSGMAAVPNGWDGVAITGGAARNRVGVTPYRNHIGGNGRNGIFVEGSGTKDNSLHDNYIGIDATGAGGLGVGNSQNGIAIAGGASWTSVADNLISGNKGHGVLVEGGGTQHVWFSANKIGTDARGTAAVPNGLHGIAVYDGAAHVTLGEHFLFGNVIAASGWSGVGIVESWDVSVEYNAIGTDASGVATNLGNGFHGVAIVNSFDNLVHHNKIAHNGTQAIRAGVLVDGAGAVRNTISQNSIHDNSGKGIALHNGGNGGIAAPSINLATCGQVGGDCCALCTLEFFSDDADEGRIYEGDMKTQQWTWAFSWKGSVAGPNVTVTATDSLGNTSEFSSPRWGACYRVYLPLVLR